MSRLIFSFVALACISCVKSDSTGTTSDSTAVTSESSADDSTGQGEAIETQTDEGESGPESDEPGESEDSGDENYDENEPDHFGRPPASVYPQFVFRGFSPDLRYAGFFTRRDALSLDITYAVIDLDKYEYTGDPVTVGKDWSTNEDPEVRKKENARIQKLDSLSAVGGEALMRKYKIDGINLGTRIFLDSMRNECDFTINGLKYTLKLNVRSKDDADLRLIQGDHETVLRDFGLNLRELQMTRVFTKGDKLLVVISYLEKCSGGRTEEVPYACDMDYEVISGALK